MKKILMTLAIAVVMLALAPVAKADGSAANSLNDCSVQGGSLVTLGNDNNGTINVTVHLCVNGNNIRVAGIFWTGGGAITFLGIDQLGWQSNATLVSAVPPGTGPNPNTQWQNTGAGTMDGFGAFGGTAADSAGNAAVGQLWTLSAPPGAEFAVHLRVDGVGPGGCSAFVSNRTHNGTTFSESAGCGTKVPEPGTLGLLGLGLLGLAAVRRRLVS